MARQQEMGETTTPLGRPEPGRLASAGAGMVFLLVGVLGFMPGVTTDGLAFAGHESTAELFGVFGVSVLHNLVHIAFGVAGLALATTARGARVFSSAAGWSTWRCSCTAWSWTTRRTSCRSTPPTTGCTCSWGVGLLALAFMAGTPRRPTNTPIHAP